MADIVMPRLSDTMEEGTILRWLKRDGEHVARGDELVEIETDKATMVYESDQDGVLQTVAAEGDTLAVGELIAHVGDDAASTSERAASESAADGAAGDDGSPPAVPPAPDPTPVPPPAVAQAPAGAPQPADAPPSAGVQAATGVQAAAGTQAPAQTAGARIKASPLARRIAGERGVDLREITGSGPGGRIVKADVLAPPTRAGIESVATAKGETTDVELSRTQQTIARRMAESKATIPDFTLHIDVDMEECVKLRVQLKRLSQHADDPTAAGAPSAREPLKAPTYNDMVVKACALALREHPTANGSYRDGRLRLHSRVNVGVAVAATSSPQGGNALVVPTVFDADEKSLGEIAREARTLAERVRSGAITPPELGGGTFTVSNLGMYGISHFTAIINPPQAGILAVGALAQRAVIRDGEVLARNMLTLTLACDHRILYGAEAALFLARVRTLLETPTALTL